MALVSVIIPAYNQALYLGAAVQSVLDQTLVDFEIILVDDGSTDETAQVARKICDRRIQYIHQENKGLSGARNTGIRNSTGRYLTYLDSDDLFLPSKLELLVRVLERNPQAGIAAGQALPIDDEGNRIGPIFDQPLPQRPVDLLLGNPLHVGSVMVTRDWQEKVGFFDENLRSYEDWDMWLRLALSGCKSIWVSEPVSLYRFHREQMTRDGAQMTTATFAVLDKLFQMPDLPKEWAVHRESAYSEANLRAAAQAYFAREYEAGEDYLEKAVQGNEGLLEDNASELLNRFQSWTELPKIKDPLRFLGDIYEHLPRKFDISKKVKRNRLGQVAFHLASEAFASGDRQETRSYLRKALKHDLSAVLNRAGIGLLIRSVLPN